MLTARAHRGRSLVSALLIVVLAVGLITSIGWAQDSTPDVDSLDEICATLEASPDASPVAGTPEAEATPESAVASPETDLTIAASPAATLEAELCGTPES